jgi:hypothetical protein
MLPPSSLTVPDVQISRVRFFMEELCSRRCSDGRSGRPAEGDALGAERTGFWRTDPYGPVATAISARSSRPDGRTSLFVESCPFECGATSNGKEPLRPSAGGGYGFTIVSITVSLIAVFIPLIFIAGVVGRLFREFGVVVTVAIVLSAMIALTLSPMMSALVLKDPHIANRNRIYQMSERFFRAMIKGYERILKLSLRHRAPVMVLNLSLIAVSGYFFVTMPKGFSRRKIRACCRASRKLTRTSRSKA